LGVGLTAEEWNMEICSGEKTRTVAWQVDSPLLQCACAWCVES
jgi:hypothetical protein